MSTTLADSTAMANAAASSAGKTIIGYNYTKNPAVTHARRLIDKGALAAFLDFSAAMM